MELGRVDPPDLDRRGKSHAVLAPGHLQRHRSALRHRIKRMDEVEVRAGRNAVEESEIAAVLHAIPSHVRDLLATWQPAHGSRNDVEAAALAEFLAGREQKLIAETDAQKRPTAVERSAHGGQEAELIEIRHRIVECAVTRQDHCLRLVDAPRVLRDHRGDPDAPERLLDRAEIPPPIIDYGDHRLASPAAAARTAAITTSLSSR